MSDFYNPQDIRTARKAHQCTYCAEAIDAGAKYVHQTGVSDGRWYTNKMHPECFEDMCNGDGEFTPYSNERPRDIGKPSQLADVFRQGVAWGLRANELTDEQIDAAIYAQCPDFDHWHEGPSLDDVRAIVRLALGPNVRAERP